MQVRTLRELASGVDALYLSGRASLPSEFLERLKAAEDHERRVIIENMVESITVFPDHLEVKVVGSPALHVLYSEVGLKASENVQVGGPT